MKVISQEYDIFVQDYKDLVHAILSSNFSTFSDKLNRFLTYLDTSSISKQILDSQLPSVDFQSWYENSCSTVKSMIGSGKLIWPSSSNEHVAMTLALLRYIGSEKEDVPAFCRKFMYSENNYNVLVHDFNTQIVEPFSKDLFKLLQRNIDIENGTSTKLDNTVIPISWYQKPIGMIGIGLFITIIGGLFVIKFSDFL